LTAVIWIRENIVFAWRVSRFEISRGGAAEAEEPIHYEAIVSGAKAFVGEAVYEEIDAGVQVREH